MTKTKKKNLIIWTVVATLLVGAWVCRLKRSGDILGWIRCAIQCGLLVAWIFSIQKRIINPRVRRHLIQIAMLYVFWMIEGMLKYTILYNYPTLNRYAWYIYYVPLTLVPVLLLFVANYVGKPDDYVMSRKWYLLLIPALLCIGIVMTNDLHQWAFVLKNGMDSVGKDGDYLHNIVWYITMIIIIFEICVFIFTLLKKCRLGQKGKRIILPIVPLLLLLVYGILYLIDYDIIAVVAGDMKAVNVYAVVFTLEFCIHTGLLPSNTHYKEMFTLSSLSVQITDKQFETYLSSNFKTELSADTMRLSAKEPVMLENNVRLSSMPIKDGYVLWTEDMTEITKIVSELEEFNEDLESKNVVLQEEFETKRKARSLEEKNRLYNQMQNQTEDKIIKLSNLTERLKLAQDQDEIKKITAGIAVVTAYLKRRNNLIFIAEENGTITVSEFEYCLRESLNNLRLFGAVCEMNINMEKPLKFDMVTTLYNAFEIATEKVMDTLKEIYVSLAVENCLPIIRFNLTCETDLTDLKEQGFNVTQEDVNEWTLEYRYVKGGAENE